VHPILYESPYYAGPDGPVGVTTYALLTQALQESNKVGVGKVVLRDREEIILLTCAWRIENSGCRALKRSPCYGPRLLAASATSNAGRRMSVPVKATVGFQPTPVKGGVCYFGPGSFGIGVLACWDSGKLPSGGTQQVIHRFRTMCPVFLTTCPLFLHYLEAEGGGRSVDFEVMCTKWRESLQTLGIGDAQVHIRSDRPGTGTDRPPSGIHELGPCHGQLFRCPLIKDLRGLHGRMLRFERAEAVRAGASADCNFASQGMESYVKLVARPKAISARRWHRLPLMRYDETLRPFQAWLLFRKLTSHKSNAEKCTSESCWCT
jgi:hypothetical protein